MIHSFKNSQPHEAPFTAWANERNMRERTRPTSHDSRPQMAAFEQGGGSEEGTGVKGRKCDVMPRCEWVWGGGADLLGWLLSDGS